LPNRLPPLPAVDETREEPIPTLFIGLGGIGRRALSAVRGDLKQVHLGRSGHPYRFFWIDLDTKEAVRDIPFDDWPGYPIDVRHRARRCAAGRAIFAQRVEPAGSFEMVSIL